MGIFDRMGRVIQANLNALLDKAEDDRKLVELDLDEMDEQIKAGHQEVVSAVAAGKQLDKRCADLRVEIERWDRRAELAVKADDEPLAREALKQKRRIAAELEQAEKARLEQGDTAARMKGDLERMKDKLAALKLRKGTIVARATRARAGEGGEGLGARSGSSAFDNFRRMEEKIEGREAETAAMAEVEQALSKGRPATGPDSLESKFRDLERGASAGAEPGTGGSEVDEELAALKKRIRV